VEIPIRLPSGEQLSGEGPVVVVGPNGSGKTRQSRSLRADTPIEFVNALRNTRVAAELPAMGVDSARSSYLAQKNQARSTHWELTTEFDSMLSQLLAEDSMAAKEFVRWYRANPGSAGHPQSTPLSRVEELWDRIYPGRSLRWRDWKPYVVSSVSGGEVEYSANQMSDGEKAALFVAARVFSADAGVLVVDEPETHFHSRLAVRLWNVLEEARRDIRFVYVTHDLTFALSRRDARYVLASPTEGLKAIDLDADLPSDIAEALLGSATLSFYASRIVFCEGDERSVDNALYNGWFNDVDTVVRPVEACQTVMRCVDAMKNSGIAQSLEVIGIVDRDYHSDNFLAAMPTGIHALPHHEVESLLAIPAVVAAVAQHVGRDFDPDRYLAELRATVNESQRHLIVIRRWKARIEPHLTGLVASTGQRKASLETLIAEMPALFDMAKWSFSPQQFLEQEKTRVEVALATGTAAEFLTYVPGKQCAPVAAREVGLGLETYTGLIVHALESAGDGDFKDLHAALVEALEGVLPPRAAIGEAETVKAPSPLA
jgi:hypothetical protein